MAGESKWIESGFIGLNLGTPVTRKENSEAKYKDKIFLEGPLPAHEKGLPKIVANYPLDDDYFFDIPPPKNPEKGLTVGEVVERIIDIYDEIYKEEEETSTITPGMIPGMMNRNRTDGKYGIWGHVLSDLFLTEVDYDPNENLIHMNLDS